jgi:hypothetical protein
VKEMTYYYWELVHELVHYRFPNMRHDEVTEREFLDRVENILVKHRQFELTHMQAGASIASTYENVGIVFGRQLNNSPSLLTNLLMNLNLLVAMGLKAEVMSLCNWPGNALYKIF